MQRTPIRPRQPHTLLTLHRKAWKTRRPRARPRPAPRWREPTPVSARAVLRSTATKTVRSDVFGAAPSRVRCVSDIGIWLAKKTIKRHALPPNPWFRAGTYPTERADAVNDCVADLGLQPYLPQQLSRVEVPAHHSMRPVIQYSESETSDQTAIHASYSLPTSAALTKQERCRRPFPPRGCCLAARTLMMSRWLCPQEQAAVLSRTCGERAHMCFVRVIPCMTRAQTHTRSRTRSPDTKGKHTASSGRTR